MDPRNSPEVTVPTAHLTDRKVQSLATSSVQEDFWDDRLPGFGVRVTQAGRKTFVVRYRVGTLRRRLSIGLYPALSLAQARDRAKEVLYEVHRGGDPQAERRDAESFAELAAEYLEKHAKRKKRTWRDDECKINREILPYWKHLKAKEIRRRDVIVLLDRIVERGVPQQANRVKSLISKIFNFGINRGIVEANPAHLLERPAEEHARERVLTESEIRVLWQALDRETLPIRVLFKLRLLTAQRGGEIVSMRWQDVEGGWWTIPGAVAKNGLSHRVPLSVQAQALLEELRPVTGDSEWVFASSVSRGTYMKWASGAAARKLVKTTGIDFVPHDLRRTAASLMTSIGVPRLVVAKILNHVETGVTAVYDRHSYDAEKKQALALWGNKVEAILDQTSETSEIA
jgi:integrase